MKRLGYETMRPLWVIFKRFGGPLGASLTALGAFLGVLGRVLGALRELLETSSAQETLYFGEFGTARETFPLKRASAEIRQPPIRGRRRALPSPWTPSLRSSLREAIHIQRPSLEKRFPSSADPRSEC